MDGGQVNFVVTPDEGYEIIDVSAPLAEEDVDYKNFKNYMDDVDIPNSGFRITKIAANIDVVIETAVASDTTTPYTMTFATLPEGVSVSVYRTHCYSDETPEAVTDTSTYSWTVLSKITGEVTTYADLGQTNFLVTVDSTITSYSVSVSGDYNKCTEQTSDMANVWRVTKINSDIVVTITVS